MNWKENFQCLKQQERSSKKFLSQSAAVDRMRSPVHMSKTLQEKTTFLVHLGNLLEAAGYGGMLIVAVRCCYLRWNRKEIFRLHASHIDYRLPFDVRCLELLRNNLPCGAVHQFLLAFLKRCVQYNTLHHIIYAVYAVMYLTFVLRLGEVKRTFVSQLSRTSTEISLQ